MIHSKWFSISLLTSTILRSSTAMSRCSAIQQYCLELHCWNQTSLVHHQLDHIITYLYIVQGSQASASMAALSTVSKIIQKAWKAVRSLKQAPLQLTRIRLQPAMVSNYHSGMGGKSSDFVLNILCKLSFFMWVFFWEYQNWYQQPLYCLDFHLRSGDQESEALLSNANEKMDLFLLSKKWSHATNDGFHIHTSYIIISHTCFCWHFFSRVSPGPSTRHLFTATREQDGAQQTAQFARPFVTRPGQPRETRFKRGVWQGTIHWKLMNLFQI